MSRSTRWCPGHLGNESLLPAITCNEKNSRQSIKLTPQEN